MAKKKSKARTSRPTKKTAKKAAKKKTTTKKKTTARKAGRTRRRTKKSAATATAGEGMRTSPFAWHELMTNDIGGATSFYGDLFGWTTRQMEMGAGMKYTIWQQDGRDIGGMMEIDPAWGPVPPHWLIYVAVPDVDEIAQRAQSLGGQIIVPPTDIPDIGRFSILKDPAGAAIAIYKRGR